MSKDYRTILGITALATVWLVVLGFYVYYALFGSFELLTHSTTAGAVVGWAIAFIIAIIGFISIVSIGAIVLVSTWDGGSW